MKLFFETPSIVTIQYGVMNTESLYHVLLEDSRSLGNDESYGEDESYEIIELMQSMFKLKVRRVLPGWSALVDDHGLMQLTGPLLDKNIFERLSYIMGEVSSYVDELLSYDN
jgi:hypothetical protein